MAGKKNKSGRGFSSNFNDDDNSSTITCEAVSRVDKPKYYCTTNETIKLMMSSLDQR